MAHGQCWAIRVPLMNLLVHTEENLCSYEDVLVVACDIIKKAVRNLLVPETLEIAHCFGAQDTNMSEEKM